MKPGPFQPLTPSRTQWIGYACALAALALRLDPHWSYGQYLWAEDGAVFYRQFLTHGFHSLVLPYAGYLHLYPRLVAFLAGHFDLFWLPVFFTGAWLGAFLFFVWSLLRSLTLVGLDRLTLWATLFLVILQPHLGEIFFNLTNCQWWLGSALFLAFLLPFESPPPSGPWALSALALCGLTGPFSILLSPFLLAKALYRRSPLRDGAAYLVIWGCALIQTTFVLTSGRMASPAMDRAPLHFANAFLHFLTFDTLHRGALFAGIFLLLFLVALSRRSPEQENVPSARLNAFILLLVSLVMTSAALFLFRNSPMVLASLGNGDRYKWFPYTFLFLSALLASSGSRKLRGALLLCFAILCLIHFRPLHTEKLHFSSFVKFARCHRVFAPLAPSVPAFPGWHLPGPPPHSTSIAESLAPGAVTSWTPSDAALTRHGKTWVYDTASADSSLVLPTPLRLQGATDLGLEIILTREKAGWVHVTTSPSPEFSVPDTLKRFYPAGTIRAQFAFPNDPRGLYLRLEPSDSPGRSVIQNISVYALR